MAWSPSGDIDIEAELKAMGFPTLEQQLEELEEIARALGLPSYEEQMEVESDPLLAELAELEKAISYPGVAAVGRYPGRAEGVQVSILMDIRTLGSLKNHEQEADSRGGPAWTLVPTEMMRRCPTCGKVKKDVDNPRLYANVCECDVKYESWLDQPLTLESCNSSLSGQVAATLQIGLMWSG